LQAAQLAEVRLAGVPASADDDVVVHGDAEWGGDVGERLDFGDKTFRMNDGSGATLDIIEPLALLTPPDQVKVGGSLTLTSKGPPY